MVEGFDKEIDLLLRQTAQGGAVETVDPPANHLDADEIAAFAENALPEKSRLNYLAHLADCNRCRKILSDVIALDSETQSEIIHADEPAVSAVAEVPWYRKLFAAPTLAYAMGALILLFAGIGVFTVMQNNSRNAEVSQTYEKQIGGKGMASDGDAAVQEMPGNQMAMNSSMNRAASSNTPPGVSNSALSIPQTASNANSTLRREALPALEESRGDDSKVSTEGRRSEEAEKSAVPAAPAPAPPPPPAKPDNNFTLDGQETSQSSGGIAQNKPQAMPDTRNVQRAPSSAVKEQKEEDKADGTRLSAKRKTAETTVAGGKTFKRANNSWVDTAYRGQPTTSISRGTNEYKSLDSGLRGIVENLGGTVVVVWKEKAFRIQ